MAIYFSAYDGIFILFLIAAAVLWVRDLHNEINRLNDIIFEEEDE